MATTVVRGGQITLDVNIRKELGIEIGTHLEMNR
jgi:bifunctional DNA-binding transcriptional regulator/antitoxin component of YhaV-PrlF toxin-antitoxin module